MINLAIGSADSPSKNLELARDLLESRKPTENSLPLKSSHGSLSSSTRKIPATSARRRGIYVPRAINSSRSLSSEPTSGDLSRTLGDVHVLVLPDADLSPFADLGLPNV